MSKLYGDKWAQMKVTAGLCPANYQACVCCKVAFIPSVKTVCLGCLSEISTHDLYEELGKRLKGGDHHGE